MSFNMQHCMLNVMQHANMAMLHVEWHATCNHGYRMLLVLKHLLLLRHRFLPLLHCWGARLRAQACQPESEAGSRERESTWPPQRRPRTSPRPGVRVHGSTHRTFLPVTASMACAGRALRPALLRVTPFSAMYPYAMQQGSQSQGRARRVLEVASLVIGRIHSQGSQSQGRALRSQARGQHKHEHACIVMAASPSEPSQTQAHREHKTQARMQQKPP